MLVFCKCIFIPVILWMHTSNVNALKRCPLQEAILPCRCLMRGEEYQIWCTHSDLPTILDGLKAVAQYITNPIDELILENNILPSLPGRTFFPLKVLRLMLRYNGLERVSSDWLAGLQSSLVEIFIVEPQLRSFPEDSLTQLNALEAVTIQTGVLKRLPLFSGLPKLRYLQIESKSLIEISPTNFKNNPRLEKLHITSSPRLTKLEANFLSDLSNLNLVNISYCGINWMHPRAISKLPALKELWLVGNKITDAGMIGKGSRELPQLEIIRLDYNHIDRLGEATFVDLPAIKKIFLSNNQIMELHHGAFHSVPLLKGLDLNKNKLRRVHPESFLQHSGSGLEELSLVENDISHVAELRSLLDALPRLIFLDMSYNNLETIPFGALRGHPTLEYLNLDYNKLYQIDREAFMAMPALRELRMRNNSLSNILESPLWNLPALKGLDLSGNYLKILEPKFLVNLPSLRRIDLSGNELTAIDPALFLSTPSLEHINVSHNDLSGIHPMTFRKLVNLYELDISYNQFIKFLPNIPRGVEYLHMHHNKITNIPLLPSTDLDLPSLRMLELTSNKIEIIPEGAFATLPQLRRLYLGQNFIQKLDENSLAGLKRLEILDLQENRITQIHPGSFKEMSNLKEINLKNNRLDILVSDVFKNTPGLKRLDLSRNQLAEILPGTLDKNLDIQVIDASHNALVKVPSTFYGLKQLRILDLRNNRIKNIDSEIIGSLINLREIKLSNNFVQEVKQGAFSNLQYLKTIHLDNNELEFIEPNAIRALPILKLIKLNRNKIKEVPNLAFNNLPMLQVVELQENELINIAPNTFNLVPNLLLLNLSSNQLNDLEGAGLQSLKSLEMLDVSNNRISRMMSTSLEKMEWLVELRMDNNGICGVQEFTFNGMPRLRVLSLKNNKIISFPEHAIKKLRGNMAVFDLDGNPLICGCNMLWLQVWLQELDQIGPHCIDGTYLRKIPLSRQDCSKKEQDAYIEATGCDTELLTDPGVYKTSQVFSQWMNMKSLKNTTKDVLGNKNQIAPSPEESDYFYDEYVDYPYNESVVDSGSLSDEKHRNKQEIIDTTVTVPESTRSPHFTPGDTPTIYAAIKNKTTKPDIPPKINNSPSSSGFTFFGIPLPNLNLNQLLGSGVGRMEAKPPSSTTPAERKTAIVNGPVSNTGRANMGNVSSNLPFHMLPPYMVNRQPPTFPEMQTGFVPILPGSGGFKPIPNPLLHVRHSQNNITTNNVPHTESPRDISVSPSSIVKTINQSTDGNKGGQFSLTPFTKTNLSKHLPYKIENNNISQQSIPTNNTKYSTYSAKTISQNLTSHNLNISRKLIDKQKRENIETKIETETGKRNSKHDLVETVSVFVHEITTDLNEETTLVPENETSIIIDENNVTEPNLVNNKSVSVHTIEISKESTSPVSNHVIGTAEVVSPNATSDIFENVHEEINESPLIIEDSERSSLSSVLIPSGSSQQSQLKYGGRSTITKVSSPHSSANSPLQSSLELPRLSGQFAQRADNINRHEYQTAATTEHTNDEEANWYFANYNKTNLEPYVARITNSNRGSQQRLVHWCLQLFIVFHYVNLLLTVI